MGLHLEVVITDGSQPIGRGVGPILETIDVMKVLENDPTAPHDLKEKALLLAGRIIEFDPDVRGGQGYSIARDILESGRALDKMNAIIDAQGRNHISLQPADLQFDVCAPTSGVIKAIDNLKIASTARLAGAPLDKGAGIYLHKKVGEHVKKGEPLYTLYAQFKADYNFAKNAAMTDNGYEIVRASDHD